MANYELNVQINGVEQSISTIGELENSLQATNNQLQNIDKNSEAFNDLNAQANKVEQTFTEISQSASTLNKNINRVTQAAGNLGNVVTTAAEVASEMGQASQTTTKLSQNLQGAAVTGSSLRAELRAIVQELQQLEPGSARFQELSQRAAELKDTIEDTNATVGLLAGNLTERLTRSISGAVSIGVAGFQAVTAAQALFGSESETINQTLLKLTALLNLSQAVETFGGLDQKITEVVAGFKSLFPAASAAATATGAAATATAAEGVAATGAAGATTAFGVALNALPLVAIVTALGLLVAGLIEYAAGSDEAEEAEKKRTEELKKQEEQIKSTTEATASEGTELFVLLNRLKRTNAGTKERSDLINEINSNYGLTLKNLKDEQAFQQQVTKSVEDYIAQLKNKVALQLVEQELTGLLTERLDIERQLTDQTQKYNTANTFFRKTIVETIPSIDQFNRGIAVQDGYLADLTNQKYNNIRATNAQFEADANSAKQSITALEARKKAIDQQVQDLATEAQKYETLLNGAFEKINTGSKNTGKNLTDLKAKQEEVNRSSIEFTEFAATKEIELQRLRVQTTADKLDDIAFETARELAEGQKRYETQKLNIEKNITDERVRISLLKTLNEDYQLFLRAQAEINAIRENEINQKRLEDARKLYAELALANQTLQTEIRFGNSDTTDSLIALENRLVDLQINNIDRRLKAENISQEEFISLQNERLALTQKYNETAYQDSVRQAEATAQVELQTTIKNLESQLGATVTYNEETKKYEVASTEEKYAEFAKLGKVELDNRLAAEVQAENIINQTAINLNKETNVKIAESDQARIDANVDAEKKAQDEIQAYKIQKAQDFLQIAQQFADGLGEINNVITQNESQELTARNEAFAASTETNIQNSYAALEAELAASNLTEEEKAAKRDELEKRNAEVAANAQKRIDANNRELAIKQFNRQKALNIVNALIAGAQSVVQGIAQFGPPPSPLGIASIVAAGVITAAQVAAIASQKFDGGSSGRGTGINASIPDTSTSTTQASNVISQASTGGFTAFNPSVYGPTTTPGGTTPFSSGSQKVYVLESDITAAQDRVRVLESNSTFG